MPSETAMSFPPNYLNLGDHATLPALEAAAPAPPALIERPRAIAHYASVSKDGRNTLRDQMVLTMEEFEDFVGVIQEAIELFLDASRPWTRQDEAAQKRYIDYVIKDWQLSNRYKDNWPITAYTVKHAKIGRRHGRLSSASTLVGADAEGPSSSPARRTAARIDSPSSPSVRPRRSATRATTRQVVAQPRVRAQDPSPSPVPNVRPRRIVMYVGAPPPRFARRATNHEVSRAPGSSANPLDLTSDGAAPFRERDGSAIGEEFVRDFLASLTPSLVHLLPDFIEFGVHDRETLMALATGPPQDMHCFIDGLEETPFKTVVLRRGFLKLGHMP